MFAFQGFVLYNLIRYAQTAMYTLNNSKNKYYT